MKTISLTVPDELYEELRHEAHERSLSLDDLVRQRVDPSFQASEEAEKPWAITPVDMGGPFLVPPERWREIEDEGRVA